MLATMEMAIAMTVQMVITNSTRLTQWIVNFPHAQMGLLTAIAFVLHVQPDAQHAQA
jgi:hypothetical protein